jgi:hypothetical protein
MDNTLFPVESYEGGNTNNADFEFLKHTCRECEHRQRWQCGGRVIQYCGKRKSNRTGNGLLKIKVTNTACGLFKKQ